MLIQGKDYTENVHLDAMRRAQERARLARVHRLQRRAGRILAASLLTPCALYVVWQIVAPIARELVK